MHAITKAALGLGLCLTVGLAGPGCNTVRGAGKDIQRGGRAVEDAAENIRYHVNVPEDGGQVVVASAEPEFSLPLPGLTGMAERGAAVTTE